MFYCTPSTNECDDDTVTLLCYCSDVVDGNKLNAAPRSVYNLITNLPNTGAWTVDPLIPADPDLPFNFVGAIRVEDTVGSSL